MNNVIDDFVLAVMLEESKIREARIKMVLRPKPRLLPTFVYHWILARMIYLQEGPL